MLLLLNNIGFDPPLILIIIIFSLWGLSIIIGISIYLYKKYKKYKRTQLIDGLDNNPYSEL